MTTPLGGPSQIIVKGRHNAANDSAGGRPIRAGDAVVLVGTAYDTDQGEPIFLVDHLAGSTNKTKFLGIALNAAPTGGSQGGGGAGTGAGGYTHVCVFGLVQARVVSGGSGAIAAGEEVVAVGSTGGFQNSYGTYGIRGLLADANVMGTTTDTAVVAGIAVQAGDWGTVSGTQNLTWVFVNGIGRHGFGGS